MKNDTTTPLQIPEDSTNDVLSEILRDGAREMLGKVIEGEVTDCIAPSMPTNATPMPTG